MRIILKTALGLALLATLSIGQTSYVNASVLGFDDIAVLDPGGVAFIPDGYAGFNWSNLGFRNNSDDAGGYPGATVSGDYTAFNLFGRVAAVGTSTFDFNSAYLAAAWNNNLSITVRGLLDGDVLYEQTVVAQYGTARGSSAVEFVFDFIGIDQLVFDSFGGTDADSNDGGSGTQFALDNFTFNNSSAVPEPTSLMLWGSGLGIVCFVRRRKRS